MFVKINLQRSRFCLCFPIHIAFQFASLILMEIAYSQESCDEIEKDEMEEKIARENGFFCFFFLVFRFFALKTFW